MSCFLPRIILLTCLSSVALLKPAKAQYVRVTTDNVNIRTEPSTTSTVVGTARAKDVFKLLGQSGDWFEIVLFSSESRYLHRSLAEPTDQSPPLPESADVRRRACIEIVRVQDRATAEAEKRYPTDFRRQIDFERFLYDKYELPIFHRFSISPSRNAPLVVECAEKRWMP